MRIGGRLAGLTCSIPAAHRSSIRAKRQIASEITQVATNIATMMNPAVLMLKFWNQSTTDPVIPSFSVIRPTSSTVPMNRATATDSPVIVML